MPDNNLSVEDFYKQHPELAQQYFQESAQDHNKGDEPTSTRPEVDTEDGPVAANATVFQDGDKHVVAPLSLPNGMVSEEEAKRRYQELGDYLGKFGTPEEAKDYAKKWHKENFDAQQPTDWYKNNVKIDPSILPSQTPESLNKLKEQGFIEHRINSLHSNPYEALSEYKKAANYEIHDLIRQGLDSKMPEDAREGFISTEQKKYSDITKSDPYYDFTSAYVYNALPKQDDRGNFYMPRDVVVDPDKRMSMSLVSPAKEQDFQKLLQNKKDSNDYYAVIGGRVFFAPKGMAVSDGAKVFDFKPIKNISDAYKDIQSDGTLENTFISSVEQYPYDTEQEKNEAFKKLGSSIEKNGKFPVYINHEDMTYMAPRPDLAPSYVQRYYKYSPSIIPHNGNFISAYSGEKTINPKELTENDVKNLYGGFTGNNTRGKWDDYLYEMMGTNGILQQAVRPLIDMANDGRVSTDLPEHVRNQGIVGNPVFNQLRRPFLTKQEYQDVQTAAIIQKRAAEQYIANSNPDTLQKLIGSLAAVGFDSWAFKGGELLGSGSMKLLGNAIGNIAGKEAFASALTKAMGPIARIASTKIQSGAASFATFDAVNDIFNQLSEGAGLDKAHAQSIAEAVGLRDKDGNMVRPEDIPAEGIKYSLPETLKAFGTGAVKGGALGVIGTATSMAKLPLENVSNIAKKRFLGALISGGGITAEAAAFTGFDALHTGSFNSKSFLDNLAMVMAFRGKGLAESVARTGIPRTSESIGGRIYDAVVSPFSEFSPKATQFNMTPLEKLAIKNETGVSADDLTKVITKNRDMFSSFMDSKNIPLSLKYKVVGKYASIHGKKIPPFMNSWKNAEVKQDQINGRDAHLVELRDENGDLMNVVRADSRNEALATAFHANNVGKLFDSVDKFSKMDPEEQYDVQNTLQSRDYDKASVDKIMGVLDNTNPIDAYEKLSAGEKEAMNDINGIVSFAYSRSRNNDEKTLKDAVGHTIDTEIDGEKVRGVLEESAGSYFVRSDKGNFWLKDGANKDTKVKEVGTMPLFISDKNDVILDGVKMRPANKNIDETYTQTLDGNHEVDLRDEKGNQIKVGGDLGNEIVYKLKLNDLNSQHLDNLTKELRDEQLRRKEETASEIRDRVERSRKERQARIDAIIYASKQADSDFGPFQKVSKETGDRLSELESTRSDLESSLLNDVIDQSTNSMVEPKDKTIPEYVKAESIDGEDFLIGVRKNKDGSYTVRQFKNGKTSGIRSQEIRQKLIDEAESKQFKPYEEELAAAKKSQDDIDSKRVDDVLKMVDDWYNIEHQKIIDQDEAAKDAAFEQEVSRIQQAILDGTEPSIKTQRDVAEKRLNSSIEGNERIPSEETAKEQEDNPTLKKLKETSEYFGNTLKEIEDATITPVEKAARLTALLKKGMNRGMIKSTMKSEYNYMLQDLRDAGTKPKADLQEILSRAQGMLQEIYWRQLNGVYEKVSNKKMPKIINGRMKNPTNDADIIGFKNQIISLAQNKSPEDITKLLEESRKGLEDESANINPDPKAIEDYLKAQQLLDASLPLAYANQLASEMGGNKSRFTDTDYKATQQQGIAETINAIKIIEGLNQASRASAIETRKLYEAEKRNLRDLGLKAINNIPEQWKFDLANALYNGLSLADKAGYVEKIASSDLIPKDKAESMAKSFDKMKSKISAAPNNMEATRIFEEEAKRITGFNRAKVQDLKRFALTQKKGRFDFNTKDQVKNLFDGLKKFVSKSVGQIEAFKGLTTMIMGTSDRALYDKATNAILGGLTESVANYNRKYMAYEQKLVDALKPIQDILGPDISGIKSGADWMVSYLSSKTGGMKTSKFFTAAPENDLRLEIENYGGEPGIENHIMTNLSLNQIAQIYCHLRSHDGYNAIRKGFSDRTKEYQVTDKGMQLLSEDVSRILSKPENAKVKEFADWVMDSFFPDIYNEANPVYKEMFGAQMPYREMFFPLRFFLRDTEKSGEIGILEGEISLGGQNDRGGVAAANSSHTFARISHNQPIRVIGLMESLSEYTESMLHFSEFAKWVRKANAFYSDRNVKNSIIENKGIGVYSLIKNHLVDIANNQAKIRDPNAYSGAMGMMKGLRSNYTKYVLGLNPRVWANQLGSFTNYATAVNTAQYMNYFKDWAALPVSEKIQADFKDFLKDPLFFTRSEKVAADMFYDMSRSIAEMARGKMPSLSEMNLRLVKWGDKTAIVMGGFPYYRIRLDAYRKQGLSEPEAKRLASKDFQEQTNQSQQSREIYALSALQRGSGGLLFPFMTTQMQYQQQINESIRNIMHCRGNVYDVKKLIAFTITQPMIYTAMSHAWRLGIGGAISNLFGQDDRQQEMNVVTYEQMKEEERQNRIDLVLNSVTSPVQGFPVLYNFAQWAAMANGLNPRPNIPVEFQALDVSYLSALDGLGQQFSTVNKLIKGNPDMAREIDGVSERAIEKLGWDKNAANKDKVFKKLILPAVGILTAIPTNNIEKIVSGVLKNVDGLPRADVREIMGYSPYQLNTYQALEKPIPLYEKFGGRNEFNYAPRKK